MALINRRQFEEWGDEVPESKTISKEELLKRLQDSSNEKSENEAADLNNCFFAPLSFFQKLSAKSSLFIDIGTDKLHYIVAKKLKGSVRVTHWGEEKLTGEELDRYRSIEIALKYLKSNIYRSGMSVHVGFFSPDINIRQVVLPKLKPAELVKTIQYKNKTELPNFEEDAIWKYQILESFIQDDVEQVRVLVTVIPRDVIEIYLDLLKRAGFHPDMLVPRPFALLSAYNRMVKNPRCDVVVDIGTDTTQISYIVENKLRYVRDFAIGANNLRKAIGSGNGNGEWRENSDGIASMENDREDIGQLNIRERLRHKVKLLKSNQNPLLQVLLGEIMRSLEFFRGRKGENPVNTIYLTGAGLKVNAVLPYLKNRLSYPISVLAPRLSPNQSHLTENAEFTGALGIGLINQKKINLIPTEFRTREIIKNLNVLLGVVLIMFLVFAIFVTLQKKKTIAHHQLVINKTEAQYQKLNTVEKRYNDVVRQIQAIEREKRDLISPVKSIPQLLDVLRLFSNEVPAEIRLTELHFSPYFGEQDKGKKNNEDNANAQTNQFRVKISGQIQGDYLMGDIVLINFINKLNELHYFKDVRILSKRKQPEKQFLEFELESYL
ncbi:MAG: hypothetical protein Kow0042_14570 [Calditrichia bacterium]